MKLSKIASILEKNINPLLLAVEAIKAIDATNNRFQLSLLVQFRQAISNIAKTGLFGELISEFDSLPIFGHAFNVFIVSAPDKEKFKTVTLSLYDTAALLIESIKHALPEESETRIAVKLPEFQTFADFIKILEKLDKAFSLAVLNPQVDGAVVIDSLEPGSKWVNVNVATTAAATLIGSLVYSGCLVSEQMNKNARAVEELRTMQLQNDAMEKVVDVQNTYLNMLVQTEAQHIYNEKFTGDPEQEARLRTSIKMFSEIIHMGGEVHPALNAPESIKSAFPDKPPHLLESRTKMLEQKAGPGMGEAPNPTEL